MPPLTLGDALAAILQIPAVSQLYEESDRLHVENLLETHAGRLKQGGCAYRIYAAAATYLGAHPELRFVETHDGTKIGDVDALIVSLSATQAKEDGEFFYIAPPGTFKFAPVMSLSLRGKTEP